VKAGGGTAMEEKVHPDAKEDAGGDVDDADWDASGDSSEESEQPSATV